MPFNKIYILENYSAEICYFGGIFIIFKRGNLTDRVANDRLDMVVAYLYLADGHKDRREGRSRQRLRIPGFFDIPTHPERVGDRKHGLRRRTHPQDLGKVRPPLFRAGLPGQRESHRRWEGATPGSHRLHAFRQPMERSHAPGDGQPLPLQRKGVAAHGRTERAGLRGPPLRSRAREVVQSRSCDAVP